MKCSLGKFHPECASCSECNQVIGKEKFSTDGGVFRCAKCPGAVTLKAGGAAPLPGAPAGIAKLGIGPKVGASKPMGSKPSAAKAKAGVGKSASAPVPKAKSGVSFAKAGASVVGL